MLASSAQSRIAVICGTPTPATIRVVQIDPGPIPTFTASAPASISARVASAVATLPATICTRFECRFSRSTASAHALGMAMRGVDHHDVDPGLDQRHRALESRIAHRGRRRHPQPPELVLGGERVQHRLLGVLQRQEPGQPPALVDDQQLLDPPLLHHSLRLGEVGRLAQHREVLARHHRAHRRPVVGRETHVAVGHDPDDDAALVDHREAGDPVALLQQLGVGERLVRPQRHRRVDDPRDEALHPLHLGRLRLDVEVAMHHADAARLRHRDRHPRLGHGVHRGTQQRDVQRHLAGEPRPRVGHRGENLGSSGNQKHVVECEGFAQFHRLRYPGQLVRPVLFHAHPEKESPSSPAGPAGPHPPYILTDTGRPAFAR